MSRIFPKTRMFGLFSALQNGTVPFTDCATKLPNFCSLLVNTDMQFRLLLLVIIIITITIIIIMRVCERDACTRSDMLIAIWATIVVACRHRCSDEYVGLAWSCCVNSLSVVMVTAAEAYTALNRLRELFVKPCTVKPKFHYANFPVTSATNPWRPLQPEFH